MPINDKSIHEKKVSGKNRLAKCEGVLVVHCSMYKGHVCSICPLFMPCACAFAFVWVCLCDHQAARNNLTTFIFDITYCSIWIKDMYAPLDLLRLPCTLDMCMHACMCMYVCVFVTSIQLEITKTIFIFDFTHCSIYMYDRLELCVRQV